MKPARIFAASVLTLGFTSCGDRSLPPDVATPDTPKTRADAVNAFAANARACLEDQGYEVGYDEPYAENIDSLLIASPLDLKRGGLANGFSVIGSPPGAYVQLAETFRRAKRIEESQTHRSQQFEKVVVTWVGGRPPPLRVAVGDCVIDPAQDLKLRNLPEPDPSRIQPL
jgi:hypothetical protein